MNATKMVIIHVFFIKIVYFLVCPSYRSQINCRTTIATPIYTKISVSAGQKEVTYNVIFLTK